MEAGEAAIYIPLHPLPYHLSSSSLSSDVLSITDNPRCSYKEADQFCSLLRQLLTRCDYQLEGGEDDEPTLLIRSVSTTTRSRWLALYRRV